MQKLLVVVVATISISGFFASSAHPHADRAIAPLEVKLERPTAKPAAPEKQFPKASDSNALQVTFDDLNLLNVINLDPVPVDVMDDLPAWLENLDGKRIRIEGYMMPEYEQEGLRGFILTNDNRIMRYGARAKIYELIGVRMAEGTTTRYVPSNKIKVSGTFHLVPPKPDDDFLIQLYEIRDAKVTIMKRR